MIIVTISGIARAGKDTTGHFLEEYLRSQNKQVITLAFGDYLKFIASKYFGYKGDEYKTEPEQRHLLQYLGTDVARKNNPNVWVDVVSSFLTAFSELFDVAIITDARFPNECDILKDKFTVFNVKVNRRNFNNNLGELNQHESETSLNGFDFDYYVDNDGTLNELREKANSFGEKLLSGQISNQLSLY